MTDIKRLIAHLDDTMSNHVTPKLGATVRQLHDWTGEFSATMPMASPDSSPPNTDDATDRIRLTKVEADALNPDEATRALVTIRTNVDALLAVVDLLARRAHLEPLPTPDHRTQSRLAYITLLTHGLTRTPPPKTEEPNVKAAVVYAVNLANLCDRYRPPERTIGPPVGGCHAHAAGGYHEPIDSHNYARQHLCRWCGDFRRMHNVNPPVKLIRLHDRGVKITTTHLRNNGIRVTA